MFGEGLFYGLNLPIIMSSIASTSPYPVGLKIKRAEGVFLFDTDDKPYFDLIAGVGVANLGHNLPEINSAVSEQMSQHAHVMVYGEYEQPIIEEFANNLLSLLPSNLDQVYPVNSGTEANEAAIKLARRATGRTEIIAFKGAYHGNTMGSLSISWNETKKAPFRPLLPQVSFIELNRLEDLERITSKTAAVILETIQGDAGVRIPDSNFIQQLRMKCTEVGALLILDEIQCGYGRSGKFSAFEHFNVVPDILTLGKALGAGLPIGALVSSKKLLTHFTTSPSLGHITTFGGNPVVAAAANAGLTYLTKHNLISEVEAKGQLFEDLLTSHPAVKGFRRKGLMMAIDLKDADTVNHLVANCRDNGVLLFWFLSVPNSFRISPPLTISFDEIKESTQRIIKELDRI